MSEKKMQSDDWSGKINATNNLIKETQNAVTERISEVKKVSTDKVKKLN